MWHVDTVEKGMDTLGRQESAWNRVFGDTRGDIGFQMSGLAPIRREGAGGLIPLPGWDSSSDWQGFVPQIHLQY